MHLYYELCIHINFGNFHQSHYLCCETTSRPPSKITTLTVWSLNKFFAQPDGSLHTGPKHVVVYYILLLIVTLLCL